MYHISAWLLIAKIREPRYLVNPGRLFGRFQGPRPAYSEMVSKAER
jgi:hypothetical protein